MDAISPISLPFDLEKESKANLETIARAAIASSLSTANNNFFMARMIPGSLTQT